MNLIMFGPPGGGKGTYSSRISEKYGIPHIATGDIFRREVKRGGELGKKVEEYLDRGDLVPDEIVNEVVKKRLSESDCENGFVLDGYPRTLPQAKALDKIVDIDLVINLDVAEKVIIDRLSNRRICRDCGEIYNLKSMPSEKEGVCDKCGGELYQRSDDKPEVIRKRLDTYEEDIRPIIEYYREKDLVVDIVAREEKPVKVMMQKIYAALEENITDL